MTFSAAAAVAPIKLWNANSDGNVGNMYLETKNSFLEFYDDDRKAVKRIACARSASADSHLTCGRSISSVSTTVTHTATPTNRSSSPSNHSQDLESVGSSDHPRAASPGRNLHIRNQHEASSPTGSDKSQSGYPPVLQMIPIMMPSMVSAYETEQETPPPTPNNPVPCQSPTNRLAAKKKDLKKFNPEQVPEDQVTTLMFRGIPCSFSQESLMKVIDSAELKGKYNFFYLPRAGNNGSNLGYAFINFVDNESAEKCTAHFNGVPLDPARSMKTCTISPGDIQGLANLRKHFRRTAVSRGCRGPVFLKTMSGGKTVSTEVVTVSGRLKESKP